MMENNAAEDLCRRFAKLFDGLTRAHGVYVPGRDEDRDERGKLPGSATTVHESVTMDKLRAHIEGNRGIGICPVRDDGTVSFGAIDIDEYKIDVTKIATDCMLRSLPLVPCLSKSGGLHLFLFTSEPVSADAMRAKLSTIAAELGYSGVEIFPKQSSVPAQGCGSWINLPFFGTNRPALLPNGEALTLEQFLDLAESRAVNAEWFRVTESGTKVKKSRTRTKSKPGFVLPEVIGDGARNSTLTSFAGAMRRNGASEASILAALRAENAARCKPPMPDEDLARIAHSVGRYDPEPTDEGLTPELAKAILAESHFARDAGGRLYVFENGVYTADGRRHVEKRVKALCESLGKTKSWNPELASRVEAWIVTDAPDLWERPALDVLNVKNGLLDVRTRELRAHDPGHLCPVQIPVSFDPGAQCPAIERFVQDCFPADSHHLAWEIAAWLMLSDCSIQKALLTLGAGSNGKSVFLTLLQEFLGRDNCSALSLHKIESDKFAAARLWGKLANICPDLPTAALSGTSMFKALTGGDTINAERKFESSWEFQPFARLVFSANSAPRSEDSSNGFFRRWLVLPFDRTFSETDPESVPRAVLDARLSTPAELSGLLNKALDALPVIRQGRFTESASTRAALEEMRMTTDPFAVWLDGATVERPDAFVRKDEIRRAYMRVCQDAGRPVMGDVQFTAALKRLRPKVLPKRKLIGSGQVQVFSGIGWVTQDPEPGGQGFEF